ncbi:hypothetical protein HMH01_16260 [Halovulum dunhuangense]|uniref:O-antigen/teichoic acid export membrane protein n=1 Tax=Halovulum dunhuangense TaxID=1505036 RepID=A0A849L783_9RHOB|nr:hypothetical protein [Halovulum dunhuangense]NNU81992.1 hypothetical protein [Halovulum dunhuangense]
MPTFGAGLRAIARNGILLSGAMWIETAIRFGYILAITHYIGAEGYGVWAYAAAAYLLGVGLSGFGLDALIPVRLGASRQGTGRYLGATLTIRVALGALAGAGLAAYAGLVEPDPTIRIALLLAVPALVGRSLSLWVRTVFVACESPARQVRLSVAMRLAEVATGVALLWAGGGILGIMAVHALAMMTEAALGLVLMNRHVARVRLTIAASEIRPILGQGATLGVTAMLTAWLSAGPLILLRHFGPSDLATIGQFALALQVGNLLVAAVIPFYQAALPALSRSVANGDPRAHGYGLLTAGAALLLFGGAAALGFAAGPWAVTTVLGAEFALTGSLLAPGIIIGALVVLPTGFSQMLLVRGRRRATMLAAGLGCAVLILAFPQATMQWGVHGAAAALAGAWFIRSSVIMLIVTSLGPPRT